MCTHLKIIHTKIDSNCYKTEQKSSFISKDFQNYKLRHVCLKKL